MTVDELIAELQQLPPEQRKHSVCLFDAAGKLYVLESPVTEARQVYLCGPQQQITRIDEGVIELLRKCKIKPIQKQSIVVIY